MGIGLYFMSGMMDAVFPYLGSSKFKFISFVAVEISCCCISVAYFHWFMFNSFSLACFVDKMTCCYKIQVANFFPYWQMLLVPVALLVAFLYTIILVITHYYLCQNSFTQRKDIWYNCLATIVIVANFIVVFFFLPSASVVVLECFKIWVVEAVVSTTVHVVTNGCIIFMSNFLQLRPPLFRRTLLKSHLQLQQQMSLSEMHCWESSLLSLSFLTHHYPFWLQGALPPFPKPIDFKIFMNCSWSVVPVV